jgi:chaperonin cofactor prefoldin
MELQEQINTYNRDLRSVKMKLALSQRESRASSMTANHIETLEADVPLYRSVGKTFVFCERAEIEKRLEEEIADLTKAQRDLTDRQEYLERRIASNSANLQDMIKA